jgi:tRNA pseudouridine55 synthase
MSGEGGLHGWLVVDKPAGVSSHRAVAIVRGRTGAKAGHAGTLDPLATGVLPVALGEATKTVRYAVGAKKIYRFRVRWGIARATDDGEGEIVEECAARPGVAAIEATLPRFIGAIDQTPPAYSAVKIGGRRAYVLARAARPPNLPQRLVEVAALRLVATPDRDHAEFVAEVGKGTYIRALARDLGRALGTVAHVAALRRLAVGRFGETHAVSLESLAEWRDGSTVRDHLLPVGTALDDVPALDLADAEALRLRLGQRVTPSAADVRARLDRLDPGTVVGAWQGHALIAVARIENGGLQPIRVINL